MSATTRGMLSLVGPGSDNYNLKSHKYACITTYQPNTKSDLNPNPNLNPTTKHHGIVNNQLNIVTCSTYPDEFVRDGARLGM